MQEETVKLGIPHESVRKQEGYNNKLDVSDTLQLNVQSVIDDIFVIL